MAASMTPEELREALYSHKHTPTQLRRKAERVPAGQRAAALLAVFADPARPESAYRDQAAAGDLLVALKPKSWRTRPGLAASIQPCARSFVPRRFKRGGRLDGNHRRVAAGGSLKTRLQQRCTYGGGCPTIQPANADSCLGFVSNYSVGERGLLSNYPANEPWVVPNYFGRPQA